MSNRGVIAAAWLFGAALVVGLPGLGLAAAGAMAQADDGPARTERFFRVEWSAGPARPDQSRIVGYVYNDYGEDAAGATALSVTRFVGYGVVSALVWVGAWTGIGYLLGEAVVDLAVR